MKKLYILFALVFVLTLFAGCKKQDKEVFQSDTPELSSSVTETSSKQETAVDGDKGSSNTETPSDSQPTSGGQTPSDSSGLPVVSGDNAISADEFDKPTSSSVSAPSSAAASSSSQPEKTDTPTKTPDKEQSSSSRPEVAPVSSDTQLWSPYF